MRCATSARASRVVSKRLGHASIAITSDLYGHLLPAVDAAEAALIDAWLAGQA